MLILSAAKRQKSLPYLLLTLFALSYLFPLSDAVISSYRFSEHSALFSYYLNYFRSAVTLLALLTIGNLFAGRVYIRPLIYSALLLAVLGSVLPAHLIKFELATVDHHLLLWILLQAGTVVTEGVIFFVLIPKALKLDNILLLALLFALAHGINLFFPLVLLLGVFYAWVIQKYNFNTHIASHFIFNFLHLLIFTYPKAG